MRWVRRSMWDVVPRDQQDTAEGLRRRQVVVIATIVVGAVLLGVSLRLEPGSVRFYLATLALAGVWSAGAFVSGRLHVGRIASRPTPEVTVRPVVAPIVIGLALALLFVVGGLVVREIPWLYDQVRSVTDFADQGALWLVVIVTAVNGIAEELFWRGAAYAAIPRNPVAWTTIAYVLATLGTGNVMLAFAAILLGVVVGLERRASGGVLAPILTHCTWSISMLFVLPLLFA
ncbi:MAG: type II CAAX endopeptidase family protein [Aeromicrobium sp.]|uniref:CPBP family intramembrane glutamic endopeptidase n=1 Tax=Aeromicrobium sp. TaxID=1871063 RepID=UPI0025C1F75F|nr:type II CAAX endopeptidase family protein [Aeromicrobium sp.]MCK5890094.1 CPBP family intramembrane metalloprotease [Aeromicrobium sp.]MDF1703866.1 type II CAAX endopeptidase family protein [Aeromicrobium sp.]